MAAANSCFKCGNSIEGCECDGPPTLHFSQIKQSAPTKKLFKSKINKEILPFLSQAIEEYNSKQTDSRNYINLDDPNLPMYKRNEVMSRALELMLRSKK